MGQALQPTGTNLLRRQPGGEIRVRHGDLRQQMDAFQDDGLPLLPFQNGKGGVLGAAGEVRGDEHQLCLGTGRDPRGICGSGRQIQIRISIKRQQRLGGAHGVVSAYAYNDVRLKLVKLGQRTAEIGYGDPLSDGKKLRCPDALSAKLVDNRGCDPGAVQLRICHQQCPAAMVDLPQFPQGHRGTAAFKVDLLRKVQCLDHYAPRFLVDKKTVFTEKNSASENTAAFLRVSHAQQSFLSDGKAGGRCRSTGPLLEFGCCIWLWCI